MVSNLMKMNQQVGIFGIFVILFLIKIEEMIDNQKEMIEVLKNKNEIVE
jgi:hypothetical protein